MSPISITLLVIGAVSLIYFIKRRANFAVAEAQRQADELRQKYDEDVLRAHKDAQEAIANAQAALEQKITELDAQSITIRQHYEVEAQKAQEVANQEVSRAHNEAQAAIAAADKQVQEIRQHYESEAIRLHAGTQAAIDNTRAAYEQKITELNAQAEGIREHYETETRKALDAANKLMADLEPLRAYTVLKDAEAEVKTTLANAIAEASALQQQAQILLAQTREVATEERVQAQQRVREIREQADALLAQATRDAGRVVAEAEKRAEQIGGDAYVALRDKQLLERAATAMRNVIEGYGDRYIIPTHSLLDDLAVEFGYDSAGQALKSVREQSKRMVIQGEAATCDYAEASRRGIATRFVIDAFNGRVDAILSRAKHDNYGTLEQEIRDAFSLVNLNGQAFRNAQILPAYLDARLAELKWSVVVHELALRAREEQRYLKEQERDRQKAEEERLKKLREAEKEKELIRVAMEEAEKRFAQATAEQKASSEKELQELRQKFDDATKRELTIAQQTKKGSVYIISNIGSFGEGIYKIGLTRRLPQERIDELGGASVPFEFDIHAVIESENAPALEHKIHKQLMAMQVNKVNFRKEFFRVNLTDIHREIEKLKQGEDFTVTEWTEMARATQYRESLDIENDLEKKEKWLARQNALADRQLRMDALQIAVSPKLEPNDDNEEV